MKENPVWHLSKRLKPGNLANTLLAAVLALSMSSDTQRPVTLTSTTPEPAPTPRPPQTLEADPRTIAEISSAYVNGEVSIKSTPHSVPEWEEPTKEDSGVMLENSSSYPGPETEISPFYVIGSINLEKRFSIVINSEMAKKSGIKTSSFNADVRASDDPSNVQKFELMSWFNDWRTNPDATVVFRTNWETDNGIICHAGNGFGCDWVNRLTSEQLKGQKIKLVQESENDDNPYSIELQVVDTYEIGYSEFSGRFSSAQIYTRDGLAFFNASDTFDNSGKGLPKNLWPENRPNGQKFLHLFACLDTNQDGVWDLWRAVILAEVQEDSDTDSFTTSPNQEPVHD